MYDTSATIADALRTLEDAGYTGQLRIVRGGSIHCFTCRSPRAPSEIRLWRIERLEGDSDPNDAVAVAGLECPCGGRGTLVFAYGPRADAWEAEALRKLKDMRRIGSS